MTERIRKMAQEALSGKDRNVDFQIPLKSEEMLRSYGGTAEGVREYLEQYPVKVFAEDRLYGRLRVGGCPYPFDLYRRCGYRSYNKYWSALCSSSPSPLFYWGWTHLVLDYDFVLKNGLRGYLSLLDDIPQPNELQQSMREVLLAIDGFYKRVAEEAARQGRDPSVCESVAKVPMEPAGTFREAVQSVWSLFLLSPDSLGRIDQYLHPFYRRDLEAGVITGEEVIELLEELFVKVFETQMYNVSQPHSGHNHLVVGGYTKEGKDGFNELSRIILECIAELPTFRPQASLRYTAHTPPEVMEFVTGLNVKCQWIVFVNDEPRIPGMVRAGIAYEDAVEYTVVGCNEWCLPSGAKMDLAHINLLHSLERLLYEDDRLLSAHSFEEVLGLYGQHLQADLEAICREYSRFAEAQRNVFDVVSSALSVPCIKSGRSITDGGSKYQGLSLSFNSISNVADSLSVIRQFVFEEGVFTMEQLLEMLKADYEGFEEERLTILKRGRFFGNDDPFVDDIAQTLVDMIYDAKQTLKSDDFNVCVTGSFVGATSPNIVLGKLTRATPDGRRSGEGFTMGVSQSDGKDRNGMTALLSSIAKLDYEKFCGCVVSNIKMEKTMADTEEKRKKLSQLFHTFLKKGGMQLQINYLSQEELLKAQQDPDRYRNLMVRVTGYSGYFTLFDRDLQNDIIRRTVTK